MSAEDPIKPNKSKDQNISKKSLSEKSQVLLWVAIIGVLGNIVTAWIGITKTHGAADVGKAQVTAEGQLVSDRIASLSVPVGTIMAFAGPVNTEQLKKSGWLVCDGTPHSTNDANGVYKKLFDAIGYSWGEGGSDTNEFRVPDLQGYFLRGVDPNGNRDLDKTNRFALWHGANTNGVGSYESDALQRHGHHLNFRGNNAQGGTPNPNSVVWTLESIAGTYASGRDNMVTVPIELDKADNLHVSSETRPKNAYVYYIIKFQ